MFEFVVDDAVVLKLLEYRDAEQLFELTDSSRLYLREWLPWVDGTKNAEDTKSFIEMTKSNLRQITGFRQEFGTKGTLQESSDSME